MQKPRKKMSLLQRGLEEVVIVFPGRHKVTLEGMKPPGCGGRTSLEFEELICPRSKTGTKWGIRISSLGEDGHKEEKLTIDVPSAVEGPRVVSYKHIGHPDHPEFPRAKVVIRLGKVGIHIQLVAKRKEVKLVTTPS